MNAMYVAAYGVLSILVGFWSWRRGHGFWLGLCFSLLLTPVLGSLMIVLAPTVVLVETARGTKRSCPHCYGLTRVEGQFCDLCGRSIARETVTGFLRLGELFVGLVVTVLVVHLLMVNPAKPTKQTILQRIEQAIYGEKAK
jgi:hypothetical protein